jgi:hypothetical protein
MAEGGSVKGIIFSYVSLPAGVRLTSTNLSEMNEYSVGWVDLTLSRRKLGFGLDSNAEGRELITQSQFKELMKKCDDNVPAGFQILEHKVYLIQINGFNRGRADLYDLSLGKLNECLGKGGIKRTPAVYIVVRPTQAIKPAEQPSSPKRQKLRALFRMDALLDRLLTTL